jgi:hypothetical protein
MDRLQNEPLAQLESRLWREHAAQESAAARAATTVAFHLDNGVVDGGAVVSNWNPLPENFVFWTEELT